MSSQPPNPKADPAAAEMNSLEAMIENQWQKWRLDYYRQLVARGTLKEEVHAMAVMCVRLQKQYAESGQNPDQAREAMQALIVPQPE